MSKVHQCKSCPWRVGVVPETDIPGYSRAKHCDLKQTIRTGMESLVASGPIPVMACHKSQEGREFACAGWLDNQLGPGNNLALRMAVMSGRQPVPVVDGPQHERFQDTITHAEQEET